MDFTVGPAIPREEAERQAVHARGLGYPSPGPRSGHLAVVGGGHSTHAYVETIRRWDGDVWAINGAYDWCVERHIEPTFFTVDPQQETARFARNAKRAVVTPWCHPAMWAALDCADVELADFHPVFSASAPNVSVIAFTLGYQSVTYFGCDCSFSDQTHTYLDHRNPPTMVVRCGGMDYLTTPAYYVQATEIAMLCREFPVCREMSGGLTRALAASEDHDIVWMSDPVKSIVGLPKLNILRVDA